MSGSGNYVGQTGLEMPDWDVYQVTIWWSITGSQTGTRLSGLFPYLVIDASYKCTSASFSDRRY